MNRELIQNRLVHIREVLPEMNAQEIKLLSEALPMDRVRVIHAPHTGLIMAKVRDCFDTEFLLGEVLVTRAEVEYESQRGQATLMGDLPSAALLAAVLEALCLKGDTDYFESAHAICRPAMQRFAARRKQQSRLVAATRVNFKSMAVEA
ncbi:MAG: phosphonate C-P lyase system protein PhnG [Desulfobacteraceae bacterium]|jgi:alpha-D-ribose 1-methylphosphonate 5-triphosphate synthase subunit PhnG